MFHSRLMVEAVVAFVCNLVTSRAADFFVGRESALAENHLAVIISSSIRCVV